MEDIYYDCFDSNKVPYGKILTVSPPLGCTPGSGEPRTLFKPLLKKSIFFLFVVRFVVSPTT